VQLANPSDLCSAHEYSGGLARVQERPGPRLEGRTGDETLHQTLCPEKVRRESRNVPPRWTGGPHEKASDPALLGDAYKKVFRNVSRPPANLAGQAVMKGGFAQLGRLLPRLEDVPNLEDGATAGPKGPVAGRRIEQARK
jgi:hypothetical protein